MKHIPADLDRLMWTIAEEHDVAAIDDFGSRFPEFRTELLKRVQMVGALRGSIRKSQAVPRRIPTFEPRPLPPNPFLRPAFAVASLVILAVLGFASYTLTGYLTRQKAPVLPTESVHVATAPADQRQPPYPPDVPDRVEQPPAPRQEAPIPSYMRPKTIRIDRAPLHSVIQMVGQECGLDLEIAPGLDNPDIDANYVEVAGIEMLRDMGRRFGFTVFPQGGNRALIIPAVDQGLAGTIPGSDF